MSLLNRIKSQQLPVEDDENIKIEKQVKEKKDKFEDVKIKVHMEVIATMYNEQKDSSLNEGEEKDRVKKVIADILDKNYSFLTFSDRQQISQEVMDEVLGLGPIEPLNSDDSISEIMINGPKQVFIEKSGKIQLTDIAFRDDDHVKRIIDKIVAPLGRKIDESTPMVDARLPDGSRVNAIIPPLSLVGPVITIRKFRKDPFKVADLLKFGTLNLEMANLLEACVKGKLNIMISGGTGSGKTTMLNVLSNYIPDGERIITVEDTAELQLGQQHVITLETRPANIEGKGAITMRDLVKNSLRMRPDRIVVGEVRSGEALDMLQAMNTGHDGSLATGHANSPRDMLSRLETMVLMAGMELPVRAIREQISSAINLIVQQNRLRDGSRKITHLTEVLGMEGDTIILQDIFVYEQHGLNNKGELIGAHKPTGVVPNFLVKLQEEGINVPSNIFVSR